MPIMSQPKFSGLALDLQHHALEVLLACMPIACSHMGHMGCTHDVLTAADLARSTMQACMERMRMELDSGSSSGGQGGVGSGRSQSAGQLKKLWSVLGASVKLLRILLKEDVASTLGGLVQQCLQY